MALSPDHEITMSDKRHERIWEILDYYAQYHGQPDFSAPEIRSMASRSMYGAPVLQVLLGITNAQVWEVLLIAEEQGFIQRLVPLQRNVVLWIIKARALR